MSIENRFPKWKYVLVVLVVALGLVYAAPNVFPEVPAVEVSGSHDHPVSVVTDKVLAALKTGEVPYLDTLDEEGDLIVRFNTTDDQMRGRDFIKAALSEDYTVALNLKSDIPNWLDSVGAQAMKLGLDLRGGVHFLLSVDVKGAVEKRLQGQSREITNLLRDERVRYRGVTRGKDKLIYQFRNEADLDKAASLIGGRYRQLQLEKNKADDRFDLTLSMGEQALQDARNYVVDQTMTVLRNRVNELGVAEPIVQRQGAEAISVDLPGIQDATQAKNILGGMATLEFHLVDTEHDPRTAAQTGEIPFGTRLYTDTYAGPMLLKNQVVLSGGSITGATATFDQNGRPAVDINLGGGGESFFYKVTAENKGKPLAIVYVETKTNSHLVNGEVQYVTRKSERVISAPTIQSALGNRFQITGLSSQEEALNLSLTLRAGSLPTNINIIEESVVGPSMGKENIEKGVFSIVVGFMLVVIFMAIYYRLFGLIADLALGLNVVLLVALLSVIHATLTLPGIAGIVLTVGMAVDANVLIFERIREELRNGASPQASIHAGYEKAFSTIVDANVTTLIVAVILYALGTGSVKGFAITLTLGLLTSMFTAITGTRAVVNWIYGGKQVKRLSIGI